MDDKLLPLAKEQLVSSFLNIAQGETMDRANQFLNAKKWCLDDALELYYVGSIDVIGPPCHLLDADEVHNDATNDISPAIKGSSSSFLDSSKFFQRRRRRTNAQIADDALAEISTSTSTDFITCRKRNNVKVCAGVSGSISSPPEGLPPRIVKRKRCTRAEIIADSAAGITTPTFEEMARDASMAKPRGARRKRRTSAQMANDASTSNPPGTHTIELSCLLLVMTMGTCLIRYLIMFVQIVILSMGSIIFIPGLM